MKKNLLALLVCMCTVFACIGCGNKKTETKQLSNEFMTITQYVGLEVEKVEEPVVTDKEVEASINSTLATLGLVTTEEVTDRPVQEGDVVTMDYVGKVDGVAFEGGTDEGATLEIGSGQFIPGFEDALIGHSVGETFDINVTFPEEYNETLAGKDAVFTITLHAITGMNVPEFTDELATQIAGTDMTAEEFRAQEKANLEESNRLTVQSTLNQSVWRELIDHCLVDEFPEDMLSEKLAEIESQYGYAAEMYGMELDEFLNYAYGISSAEMAKDLIKQETAVKLIAEEENIVITEADYERELEEYATQYGYTDFAAFEELIGREEMERIILQNAVGEWLVENCKQVEK